MLNPFITSGYAGPKYFCDREKETGTIVRLLQNGNNVALISPRRFGKTDLIRHCFEQAEIKEKYYTFIIDIYSTKTYTEMVATMGKSILETLKPRGRKAWEQFLNIIMSVRPGISFDAQGSPTWSLGINSLNNPTTTLEEIFQYLNSADKPCIIAIDEFQQITKYGDNNIEAMLRTQIQYCSNAKFIFSGSHMHLMSSMFTSASRPFYQSVTLFRLEVIPQPKYAEFCQRMFKQAGKNIEPETIEQVYEMFDGVTFYMQRIMNELFTMTANDATCQTSMIEEAITNIIGYAGSLYEDLIYQLPIKQADLLRAIAVEGKATKLTSGNFTKLHNLTSPSSVKSALPALIDKGLVCKDKETYQVYDKFLELWLLK